MGQGFGQEAGNDWSWLNEVFAQAQAVVRTPYIP